MVDTNIKTKPDEPRVPQAPMEGEVVLTEEVEALGSAEDTSEHSSSPSPTILPMHQPRPTCPRSSTEPSPSALLLQSYGQSTTTLPYRGRNRSPYSRSHLRTRSSAASLTAPPMTRAHSLPSVTTAASLAVSPSMSPLRSPARTRSPMRPHSAHSAAGDDFYNFSLSDISSISEDAELDITPRPLHHYPSASHIDRLTQSSPLPYYLSASSSGSLSPSSNSFSNSFPRRRRPASPLQQAGTPTGNTLSPYSTSANNSPRLAPTKFINEPFPTRDFHHLHHAASFSSSSVPSTPTSARSRSPSISSLETIPDSPAAEMAALEEEEEDRKTRLEREKNTNGEKEGTRRGSMDVPGMRSGVGFGFGTRDKRKRWSVCGAERRGDLDLETIWED